MKEAMKKLIGLNIFCLIVILIYFIDTIVIFTNLDKISVLSSTYIIRTFMGIILVYVLNNLSTKVKNKIKEQTDKEKEYTKEYLKMKHHYENTQEDKEIN